jgi:hypothetical protein
MFSVGSVPRLYTADQLPESWGGDPCGSGFEYLHRDPASRRRRRKGKSQIWDSKIWSRVPRDSDLRKTALARASSIYKRQTRPLVREGAPQKQDCNCQIVIWSWVSDGARHQDLLADWPSVAMWLWLGLESLETAVVTVGGWCEMAASLREREPGSRGMSTVGRRYQAAQWRPWLRTLVFVW